MLRTVRWCRALSVMLVLVANGSMAATVDFGDPAREDAFLKGVANARLFDGKGGKAYGEQEVIRAAYGLLADHLRASGVDLSITVADFRTFAPKEFRGVPWSELATPLGGRHVNVARDVVLGADNAPLGVSYAASWADWPVAPASAEVARTITTDDALRLAALEQESLREVVAVTTYAVALRFQGEERSYRAAVVWTDPQHNGLVRLSFQDNVIDHVDSALAEKLSVNRRASLQERQVASSGESLVSTASTTITALEGQDFTVGANGLVSIRRAETESYDNALGYPSDGTGHLWNPYTRSFDGGHYSSATFRYTCGCTGTRSSCTPSILSSAGGVCRESGSLTAIGSHKPRTTNVLKSSSVFGGGAACDAGAACHIQWCPGYVCGGFSLSGSANGAGVGFQFSGSEVWSGDLSDHFECAPCEVPVHLTQRLTPSQQQLPTDYPAPGSEGGGALSVYRCDFQCHPKSFDGIHYTEECNTVCSCVINCGG